MPQPKVSIIIDNFNYDRFLAAALDSALAQTYQNCEVIVVDDGSTDTSRQILGAYENRALILLKENGGQSSAFNLGFQKSTGDLIAFLDSDDKLFPDAIESVVACWDNSLVKVQFPLEILSCDDQPTGLLMPRNPLSTGAILNNYLVTGRYVTAPTSGNVFSRKFLTQIFPIPEKEWAQTADGYINTCAPFFGPVKALRQALGNYRIHGKSMSAVSYEGSIDVTQLEKLIGHAILEKKLFEKMAQGLGHQVPPSAVVGHWMHLKLCIAFYKLSDFPPVKRTKLLLSAVYAMIASVARTNELSVPRKIQNILWTVSVTVLPRPTALALIEFAFDRSPNTGLLRFMRSA